MKKKGCKEKNKSAKEKEDVLRKMRSCCNN
jgi:hypothetical protein